MLKAKIINLIKEVVKDFNEVSDFSVEVPSDKRNGDYSTNVALILAKKLGKNPSEVANSIKEKIGKQDFFEKIEVANGFINFFVSDKVFIENLKNIDEDFGKGNELKSKKIIIDYTDPNILKEFHIGHLMSNAIGESLSRIFEFQGAKVKRACYQSDVGISIAKAVWGAIQMEKNSHFIRKNDTLTDMVHIWGTAYRFGSEAYESSDISKKEITELNKKIFEKSDKNINKLYNEGKKVSLKYFNEIYKKLGTEFDYFIFESQVADLGKKIVEKGLKDGIFEKGENGAIIFKGEKYGLHTRVFINSDGLPTYEAKDLGLAKIKYEKYAYDKSVIVTGNEVNDYFKVMLCAMDKVLPKLAEKTKHIGHGMLRLPEGKMSSRTGKVITGESLIEKVEELVREKIKDRELSEKEKKEIIEDVAIGAIKYSILKQTIGHDIIFNFEHSISFEGDSGPYLQYSYARAKSVLRKAKEQGLKASFKNAPEKITQLEKIMCYFPDIVVQAGKSYEPHYVSLYLTELAATFNTYYAENKIVDEKETSPYRVALTIAFTRIMENGLWLLGMKTLNRM
ncbi:MAG: arginine--tRNA ligase [Candidatus Staskawiczbacteria bacterium]|nr:arginine--tRNA ligase [Candidatus Staskawiczbacteria bacterium]